MAVKKQIYRKVPKSFSLDIGLLMIMESVGMESVNFNELLHEVFKKNPKTKGAYKLIYSNKEQENGVK
jgi:hypothetical protein